MKREMLGSPLEEELAEELHNTCVPDHETCTYGGRPIAERRAFIRQAKAAIQVVLRRGGSIK